MQQAEARLDQLAVDPSFAHSTAHPFFSSVGLGLRLLDVPFTVIETPQDNRDHLSRRYTVPYHLLDATTQQHGYQLFYIEPARLDWALFRTSPAELATLIQSLTAPCLQALIARSFVHKHWVGWSSPHYVLPKPPSRTKHAAVASC
jgi:hypothetical protein